MGRCWISEGGFLAHGQVQGSLQKLSPPGHSGPLEGTQTGRRKQRTKVVGKCFTLRASRLHWKIPPCRRTGPFTQTAHCSCNLGPLPPSVPTVKGAQQRVMEEGHTRAGAGSQQIPRSRDLPGHCWRGRVWGGVPASSQLHSDSSNLRITNPSRPGIFFSFLLKLYGLKEQS